MPIAVGLGLAAQLDGDDRIVVTTFGDGSTSIGAFHEAMNLAALWRLPVVFVCQNNQWGEHTPIAGYTANTDLAGRAAAYGMRAVSTNGFDPIAAYRTLQDAVQTARSGSGPVFVEAQTYRLSGHSAASDYSYMPREEFAAADERDPVPAFRRWLVDSGSAEPGKVEALEHGVDARVEAAFDHASKGASPAPEERFTDVFADERLVRTQ
jgi:pyruvate dehydrogenase E1 component alpha subunit